ncbi:hypothetical protein SAMN02745866_03829 [Alteromonadaceae bacterium Bs31]|nr:hypothetical protein SAMN02745866_03829 [Alteromonadaceae bacterium Bs31]
MAPAQLQYWWVYLVFVVAAIAAASYELLPEKELEIMNEGEETLFMDSESHGNSVGVWLNEDTRHFRCTFINDRAGYKYCGLVVTQGDNPSSGIDLTGYTRIKVKLSKLRTATYVRLFIRSYVEGFSSPLDSERTSKYMRILIPARELDNELEIDLKQFTLAEWWVKGVTLPSKLAYPEFENVIRIGVDFPHPIMEGENELQVDSIKLMGNWLSREEWYLAIFLACFATLLFSHAAQEMKRHHKASDL